MVISGKLAASVLYLKPHHGFCCAIKVCSCTHFPCKQSTAAMQHGSLSSLRLQMSPASASFARCVETERPVFS